MSLVRKEGHYLFGKKIGKNEYCSGTYGINS